MKPLVSVSVVTYNHERYIGECLDSIVAQTGPFDLEVVVGDDASLDTTREIVATFAAKYPQIVRPLFHRQNIGAAANWQSILDACRGRYVAHLDGDDVMFPGKLQRQLAYFAAHPDAAIVFHNMQMYDSDAATVLGLFTPANARAIACLSDLLAHGTVYCCGSMMFRGDILATERVNQKNKWVVDWLFQMQIAKHGAVGYIDEALGMYRRHRESFTAREGEHREDVVADQLLAVTVAEPWVGDPAAPQYARARILYGAGRRALQARDYVAAKRFLFASREFGVWASRGHRAISHLAWCPPAARLVADAADAGLPFHRPAAWFARKGLIG